MRWLVRGASVFVLVGPTLAQEAPPPTSPPEPPRADDELAPHDRARLTFWAIWDNDSVYSAFFDASDRYETNHVRFALALESPWVREFLGGIPTLDGAEFALASAGISIGQSMYTPADLSATALIVTDRPYGGWLFVGPFVQRRDGRTMEHVELHIGGTADWSAAEDTQDWIHDTFSGVPPQGWDNQIEEEIGVNLQVSKAWRLDLAGEREGFGVQGIPELSATMGTIFSHAQAGALLRAGWNLPDDFGPGRADRTPAMGADATDAWSVYIFVRGAGRWVLHNTFLDGSIFNGGHGVEKEPLTARGELGLAVRLFHSLEISYTQAWTTDEFELQEGGRHRGAYTLMWVAEAP